MSLDAAELREQVFAAIRSVVNDKSIVIADDTVLIGDGSILDSMRLVQLCLVLEDLAGDHDGQFDWTSESAMSRNHSMFRTAGSITAAFAEQVLR